LSPLLGWSSLDFWDATGPDILESWSRNPKSKAADKMSPTQKSPAVGGAGDEGSRFTSFPFFFGCGLMTAIDRADMNGSDDAGASRCRAGIAEPTS